MLCEDQAGQFAVLACCGISVISSSYYDKCSGGTGARVVPICVHVRSITVWRDAMEARRFSVEIRLSVGRDTRSMDLVSTWQRVTEHATSYSDRTDKVAISLVPPISI